MCADTVCIPSSRPGWTFVSPSSALNSELRTAWEQLLARSENLNAVHQSPEWLEFKQATDPSGLHCLAEYRDSSGELRGVVPMSVSDSSLRFSVAGRELHKASLRLVDLLGSELLLPPRGDLFDELFRALNKEFQDCQCIRLPELPTTGFTWKYLKESKYIRKHFLPYALDGIQDYFTVPLKPSFSEYLAQFSSKKRYNFRRQVKQLKEECGGSLELVRIDSRADIPLWIKAYASVPFKTGNIGSSKRMSEDELAACLPDMADRGLLRNYVLKSQDRILGIISGRQYRDVYNLSSIRHDHSFDKLSPGTSLLYLAIEDLLKHRPVKMISLGFGAPKQQYSTGEVFKYVNVLLMRKSPRNHIYRTSHAAFRSLVRSLKHLGEPNIWSRLGLGRAAEG
jgi:hypothetical protein